MSYPLIEKWLGLEVENVAIQIKNSYLSYEKVISADKLEAKLAEGFEIYRSQLNYLSLDEDWKVALAIGKQPIKKKTREEAALEFIQWISEGIYPRDVTEKAKEILEME